MHWTARSQRDVIRTPYLCHRCLCWHARTQEILIFCPSRLQSPTHCDSRWHWHAAAPRFGDCLSICLLRSSSPMSPARVAADVWMCCRPNAGPAMAIANDRWTIQRVCRYSIHSEFVCACERECTTVSVSRCVRDSDRYYWVILSNIEFLIYYPSGSAGRVLHAQVGLNSKFNKQYRNAEPVLEPPFPDLTLGQAYHLVSEIRNIGTIRWFQYYSIRNRILNFLHVILLNIKYYQVISSSIRFNITNIHQYYTLFLHSNIE